jgi:predicted O-methyltransferase YrrM
MSYEHIPGYSGFLWLYDQAVEEAKDDAIFVEVGVALGHSLAYLARKVIDSGKRIEVWAVDPWGGYARNGEQQEKLGEDGTRGDFQLFLDQMIEHAPEELEFVRVVRATSDQACKLFDQQSVDLVLIDAAHDEVSVSFDIDSWIRCVKNGGVLAGDDHEPNYPGVEKACRSRFGLDYQVKGSTWYKRM